MQPDGQRGKEAANNTSSGHPAKNRKSSAEELSRSPTSNLLLGDEWVGGGFSSHAVTLPWGGQERGGRGRVMRGGWPETCWLACRPLSDSKHSATFPVAPNAPQADCRCFQEPVTATAVKICPDGPRADADHNQSVCSVCSSSGPLVDLRFNSICCLT